MNIPNAATSWIEPERRWPLLAAAVVFLLVYAVELTNFGFGIDEELATFDVDRASVWLEQGRWGMSLVTWLLPNFEAIPVLSTLLFGAGLLAAAERALRDFDLRGPRAMVFAVVLVGFPLWLNIAQFSTLAAGFGFGIAAASWGAGLCASPRGRDWLAGVLLMAFATAVYQTLAVYSLLYLLLLASARWYRPVELANARARLRLWTRLVAGWAAALFAYALLQWLALRLSGTHMGYVGGFVQTDWLREDPWGGLGASLRYFKRLLNGHNDLYLHCGIAMLAMSWVGLVCPALPEERSSGWRRRGFTFAVFALAMALLFVPVLLSYATLPARAQVAWPLLVAWLAARCPFPDRRAPWLRYAALGYFTIVATSVGSSLFYTDLVVRAADRDMTLRLVPEMITAAGGLQPGGKIPFTISGIHRYPLGGQVEGAQMFGVSFYEHDGGSVWRLTHYWKVLGIDSFEPRLLSDDPAWVEAAAGMPDWPATGSVRFVDGAVVVRLGPATPGQLATH